MSLDPLETPNRYAYVGGDVVNRVDRSGLQGEIIGTTCAAFIAGDGPFPFGDAACLILLFGTAAYTLLAASYLNNGCCNANSANSGPSFEGTVAGAVAIQQGIGIALQDMDHLCFSGDYHDCQTAAKNLLERMATVSILDAVRHLVEFVTYVDGGFVPPFVSPYDNQYWSIVYDPQYYIYRDGRIVGRHEPGTMNLLNTGFAAYHVYLEFNLAGTSTVVDTGAVIDIGSTGSTINQYQARLLPLEMPWSDCEAYYGINLANARHAIDRIKDMVVGARGRSYMSNVRTVGGCPKPAQTISGD